MPAVDRGLQAVALGQKCPIDRNQRGGQRLEFRPEGRGRDAGAGQGLLDDEIMQALGDLEAADREGLGHRFVLSVFLDIVIKRYGFSTV